MNRTSGQTFKCTPAQGLFSATLGFFIGFAAVALFGPTAKQFKDVMGLTPLMTGFLVAIPALSGSLLRIPFGAWVDTAGGRKPILVLLSLSFVGMLSLFAFIFFLYPDGLRISHYPILLIIGILCGCGIATFSAGIAQASYWFPQKRQGWALGMYGGVGNMAPGIFSLLLPISLINWGLLGSYLAWLIFLVAGIVVFAFFGRDCYYFQLLKNDVPAAQAKSQAREMGQEIFPSGKAVESLRIAASNWKTWVLVAIYFTTFGGFIALTAWFPTYWTSFYGQKVVTAGLLTALFSILASIVRVGGGSLSDRLGGERTLLFALTVLLFGSIVMTLSRGFAMSITGEVLMAAGMGVGNAAVFKLVPQEIKEAVGGASGWVGGIGAFGGFALPPLMGLFVRMQGAGGYSSGFSVFAALSVVSIALAYILRRVSVASAVKQTKPVVALPEQQH